MIEDDEVEKFNKTIKKSCGCENNCTDKIPYKESLKFFKKFS